MSFKYSRLSHKTEYLSSPFSLQTTNCHILSYEKGTYDAQDAKFLSIISIQIPKQTGMSFFIYWTADIMCAFIKLNFNISFNNQRILNPFERLRLNHSRPTYTLQSQSPIAGFVQNYI